MGTGEDARALASPAREGEDGAPAAGADDNAPVAGAEDDGPAADADGSVPGPAPAEPRHSTGAPVWVAGMAALLALLIAGVVVSVVFLGHVRASDAQSSRRQAAVAAARTAVADLTTADYQNPQQYIDKLRGVATGSFLSLLTNAANGFKGVLAQGKVQTAGTVVDVGVQRIGTDTVQLSVLADVTVKNSQTPNGSERAYRLSVSMISAGSRWLVSNVEFVQ